MKRNFLIVALAILLILLVILGLHFRNLSNQKTDSSMSLDSSKVVEVDQIVAHPDHFKGFLGVQGTVMKVDQSKDAFILGCEDACIMMPVNYKGQMPEVGSQITVFGEVKKSEEKFVFEAQEIKVK